MLSQNREDIYWSQCQRVHTKVLRLLYPTVQPRPPRFTLPRDNPVKSRVQGIALWHVLRVVEKELV